MLSGTYKDSSGKIQFKIHIFLTRTKCDRCRTRDLLLVIRKVKEVKEEVSSKNISPFFSTPPIIKHSRIPTPYRHQETQTNVPIFHAANFNDIEFVDLTLRTLWKITRQDLLPPLFLFANNSGGKCHLRTGY